MSEKLNGDGKGSSSSIDKNNKRKRDSIGDEAKAKRARAQDANGEPAMDLAERLDSLDAAWRISKPMGGRMLDIDPILTDDGQ